MHVTLSLELMLSSDDLHFFMTLANTPSFAAAARQLSVTPPAVTQRLRAIEERLGVQLFHRNPRGVSLTDEGALLAERAVSILADLGTLLDELGDRRNRVRGHLRVAASKAFGRRHVAPVIASYRLSYPDVRVTLDLSDNPARFRTESWDVVVHIGQLPIMDLQMVTLAPNDRIICCSPDYATKRGTPETPDQLSAHECVTLFENDEDVTLWRLHSNDGESVAVRVESALTCNDGDVVRDWALAGHGIILRSEWHVTDDIAAGRLIRILPKWRPADAPVLALLASRSGRTARTQHFIDHLRQSLNPTPWR